MRTSWLVRAADWDSKICEGFLALICIMRRNWARIYKEKVWDSYLHVVGEKS